MKKKGNELKGKPLSVSVSIGSEYSRSIKSLMKNMHNDVIRGVEACFVAYAQDSELPSGGNIVSQLKIIMGKLSKKYEPAFSAIAKKATKRMIERVLKNSSATLKLSLREISEDLSLKTDFMGEKLKNITQASIQEGTELIKSIPHEYLSDVQKVVMHSISSQGKGFAEVKSFLTKIYKGRSRKAELTALDQTRKAYQNIQAERLKQLGVKKFEWIHSGGGNVPRQLHVNMSGKVFSFDDPPYIGDMYGEKVYGLPGQLPNCRCRMKPVVDFGDENEQKT